MPGQLLKQGGEILTRKGEAVLLVLASFILAVIAGLQLSSLANY